MQKLSYTDKVALNSNSSIPDINKVNASDMNEIKTKFNGNVDFWARQSYEFTPVYTNYNPGYELFKIGNIVIFAVNSIFMPSINANEWTVVGSIPAGISPSGSASITAVTTISSGSSGDILGYGRTDILTNGNLRVKSTTANSGLTFFSFIAVWTI